MDNLFISQNVPVNSLKYGNFFIAMPKIYTLDSNVEVLSVTSTRPSNIGSWKISDYADTKYIQLPELGKYLDEGLTSVVSTVRIRSGITNREKELSYTLNSSGISNILAGKDYILQYISSQSRHIVFDIYNSYSLHELQGYENWTDYWAVEDLTLSILVGSSITAQTIYPTRIYKRELNFYIGDFITETPNTIKMIVFNDEADPVQTNYIYSGSTTSYNMWEDIYLYGASLYTSDQRELEVVSIDTLK